jgi:hypothetical protein
MDTIIDSGEGTTMKFQFDIADIFALIAIGWVAGMLTDSPLAVFGAQITLVAIDWTGRRIIDWYVDRKFAGER